MAYLKQVIAADPSLKIMWLVPRETLGKDQRGRIEELTGCDKWKYYFELSAKEKGDTDRAQEQYFVCCLHSIGHSRGLYDFIVMDECETLLKCYDTENTLIKQMKGNWNQFIANLQNAKKVIYLDGFVTGITKDFITNIGAVPYILGSSMPPDERRMEMCKKVEYIYNAIDEDLRKGLKVAVVVGAKGKSDVTKIGSVEHIYSTFLEKYPDMKILAYHADKSVEKKKLEGGKVNDIWCDPEVKLVVYNASCSVGISCDPKQPDLESGRLQQFEKVYGICNPSIVDMRDFFQMLYRVRQPLVKIFKVYLSPPQSKGRRMNEGVERLLPHQTDKAYWQLQKHIANERKANNSKDYKALFAQFCSWMNIKLSDEVKLELTEEQFTAVSGMLNWDHN
ncbi:hypothetical protein HKX48_003025, partial [Thoreauomyces humboldtii]